MMFLRKYLTISLFILYSFQFLSLLFAQVNIEAIRLFDVKQGAKHTSTLSLDHLSGNSSEFDIDFEWRTDYFGKRHQQLLIMEYHRSEQSRRLSTNKGFSHFRFVTNYAHYRNTEVYIQYEFNEFINLDRRFVTGIGTRFHLVNRALASLYYGNSIMFEYEHYEVESINSIRFVQYLNLSKKLNERLDYNHVIYFLPKITSLSDYRVLSVQKLEIPVYGWLALMMKLMFTYDNEPHSFIRRYDLELKSGFKFSF